MKKFLMIFAVASAIILGSCDKTPDDLLQYEDQSLTGIKNGDIIPGQYIVLLKDGVTSIKSAKLSYPDGQILMRSEMQKVLAASEISEKEPLQVFTAAVEGFAVKLSEEETVALEKNPGVLGVWPDRMVVLAKPPTASKPLPAEVIPPGISRVGGGLEYTSGKKAWIIDTGIDLDHPDLNVDATSGINLISPTRLPDDDHGHGTHCAGIVAAIDNTVGVVGVVPGAKVVPIKVLDRRGSGAYSVIIAGVDYVFANGVAGDAVNMSLGGPAYEPLDDAIVNLGGKGLFVALAAGNESDDASKYSPARTNGLNIFTVSACDKDDKWAYFSNFGSPVDFCAPGMSILSLYKGGGTAIMSGTSMAAPHVCGVLLATGGNPKNDGTVTGDPDGEPDPIVHK